MKHFLKKAFVCVWLVVIKKQIGLYPLGIDKISLFIQAITQGYGRANGWKLFIEEKKKKKILDIFTMFRCDSQAGVSVLARSLFDDLIEKGGKD